MSHPYLHLLKSPPWNGKFAIACSGGMDSMALLHFVFQGKRTPEIVFFNHGTQTSKEASVFVKNFCKTHHLNFHEFTITRAKDKKESLEEYWRAERYKAIYKLEMPVLTAHHLDDVIETWLFSSFNGTSKIIPYNTRNVYRPFMLNSKQEIKDWAIYHNVKWLEDKSNNNLDFARCRIRHNIVPEVLKVNPGIGKVMRKKLKKMVTNSLNNEQEQNLYFSHRKTDKIKP